MKGSSYLVVVLMQVLAAFSVAAAEKTGVLQWSQRVVLSAPVSGVVTDIFVKAGDKVTKGQRLIKLDDRGFKARIKQTRAVLTRAKETYEEAKRELGRAAELFDRDAISVRDKQLVKIDYTKAFASMQEAQALLTRALLDMEYSTVKSPINGIVISRLVDVGQTVNNTMKANAMVVVANNQEMIARVLLAEKEIKTLTTGLLVDIRVQGSVISGVVSLVGQEAIVADGQSRYRLDVVFENPGLLRQGQAATLLLP